MTGEEWSLWLHRTNILTNNDRKHFHDKGHKDAKAALKALGAAKARQIGRFERVRMDVEVSYPPRVYMDAANLQATMKVYVDGMTSLGGPRNPDVGFLKDDSDKFFSGPFIDWSGWPSGRESMFHFWIRLTPLDPWVKPPKPHYL
ncbi:RusA-like Holliday junction resolvase [Arthrobacter phage SilentRX]|uniref:RusA-like resolvase n=1 Tax=Arthrobacter phage SilentRX TaxID=2836091 RepID=A0A8F3ECP1_9CAUD|nr:RusA-like Holliday junction resolvase [Arthrobacter phage SilentRX]QWY82781.1 RusA-like resolvase [Arthrobacter phage SilentRX]